MCFAWHASCGVTKLHSTPRQLQKGAFFDVDELVWTDPKPSGNDSHSYWEWHMYSWFTMIYLLNMVIFHNYIGLPEGWRETTDYFKDNMQILLLSFMISPRKPTGFCTTHTRQCTCGPCGRRWGNTGREIMTAGTARIHGMVSKPYNVNHLFGRSLPVPWLLFLASL